jgi:hypothetical protein
MFGMFPSVLLMKPADCTQSEDIHEFSADFWRYLGGDLWDIHRWGDLWDIHRSEKD